MRAYVDFHGTLVIEAQDDTDDELLHQWMSRHSKDPEGSVVVLVKNPQTKAVEAKHDTRH